MAFEDVFSTALVNPVSLWRPISRAPKDQWIDAYNCHTGERHVTRWIGTNDIDVRMGLATRWRGWDPNWGNEPTHFQPLPQTE